MYVDMKLYTNGYGDVCNVLSSKTNVQKSGESDDDAGIL